MNQRAKKRATVARRSPTSPPRRRTIPRTGTIIARTATITRTRAITVPGAVSVARRRPVTTIIPWPTATIALLPIGLIQFYASASQGLWYARSEAFMQGDLLQTLRWFRTFGDVVFMIGAFAVIWQFVSGLLWSSARLPVNEAVLPGQP